MKIFKLCCTFLVAIMLVNIANVSVYANSYSVSVVNTNSAVSINGNTYNAYLLFESVENNDGGYVFNPATCLAVSYTPSGGSSLSGDELLTWLGESSRTNEELYDFSTNIYNNFIDVDPAPAPQGSSTATGQQATIPLTIPGYYIVEGGAERIDNHSPITALVSLSVVNPTSTINPKLDVPSLEKLVYHDNEDAFTKYSDHAIGDDVIYQIKTTVPTLTGYADYNYTITDTLDAGLTFNDDLTLKAELASGTITVPTSYYTLTVQAPPSNSFTLSIDILALIHEGIVSASDTLITEFSATINENAIVNPDGTNDNNATLSYSNNPQDLFATGTTPTDTTQSSTFSVNLFKTNTSSQQLNGAEFCITLDENLQTDSQGTPTNALSFIKENNEYTIAPSNYSGDTTTIITAGSIQILGLNSAVTYYLHEITPPEGYVLSTEPYNFSLVAEYDTITGDILPDYPKLYINSQEASSTTIEVVNYTDTVLPQTGDNSRTIIILSGALLLFLGISILFVIKKGNRNVEI